MPPTDWQPQPASFRGCAACGPQVYAHQVGGSAAAPLLRCNDCGGTSLLDVVRLGAGARALAHQPADVEAHQPQPTPARPTAGRAGAVPSGDDELVVVEDDGA